jgi:hypothetical protein
MPNSTGRHNSTMKHLPNKIPHWTYKSDSAAYSESWKIADLKKEHLRLKRTLYNWMYLHVIASINDLKGYWTICSIL